MPARRTFMMLAVVAGAQALQLRISGSRVLALAAVAVVARDPCWVLAGGFWLSFLPVSVLLAVGARVEEASRPERRRDRWLRGLKLATRLQWTVTWALAPPLAWTFHEVSLVSPLANAYAIPVIELLVTPLSLLLAAVSLVPGLESVAAGLAWLAHGALALMMRPTAWLAALPAWPVPAGPAWVYLLAMAGAAVALWPAPLEPWLPRRERRAARLPTASTVCPPQLPPPAAPLSIVGVREGDRLRRPASSARPLQLKLSALGGSGTRWWFLNGAPVAESQPGEGLKVIVSLPEKA